MTILFKEPFAGRLLIEDHDHILQQNLIQMACSSRYKNNQCMAYQSLAQNVLVLLGQGPS